MDIWSRYRYCTIAKKMIVSCQMKHDTLLFVLDKWLKLNSDKTIALKCNQNS